MRHIFQEINSTNERLRVYNPNLWDSILAIEQHSGRGRRDNSWHSPKGGFYFSISAPKHRLLPLLAGLSAKLSLESFHQINISLKWPNDLLFDGKKLGGILCESNDDFAIVGVGINVETTPDISSSISLKDLGLTVNIYDLANEFENILKHELINFDSNDFFIRYRKAEVLLGKTVKWNNSKGLVVDINDCGELVVEAGQNTFSLNAEEVHLEH